MRRNKRTAETLTKQLSVRMTDEMFQRLSAEADRQGLAASVLVKEALEAYLAEVPKDQTAEESEV